MSPVAYLLTYLSIPTAQLQELILGLIEGRAESLQLVVLVNCGYTVRTAWKAQGEGDKLRAALACVIGVLLPTGLWFDGQPLHACCAAVLGLLLPCTVLD